MLWFPVVPFAVYYGAVFRFNDVMAAFNEQNLTPSPAPHLYIFGYGMLLIVALPGLVRAVRRFERDGDQFMLLWFVLNVLLLYAPFNLQRRLSVGLIIPLVFFAVRSLEDFWFFKVPKRWRTPAFVTLLVLLLPTNLLNLAIPLFGVSASPESGLENGLLVESDYADASTGWNSAATGTPSRWLRPRSAPGSRRTPRRASCTGTSMRLCPPASACGR